MDDLKNLFGKALGDWRILFGAGLLAAGVFAILLSRGLDVQVNQFFAQEPCTPVQPTAWDSNAAVPAGQSAWCKPNPNPPALKPPPPPPATEQRYQCFKWQLGADNTVGALDALVNKAAKAGSGAGTLYMRGTYYNNCAWPVQMTAGAAGGIKAGNTQIPKAEWKEVPGYVQRRQPPPSADKIPSCWNGTPSGACQGSFEAAVSVQDYNCGRVEVTLGWRHGISGKDGSPAAAGNFDQDGYTVVMNYGRDCSGALGEKRPGSKAAGSTAISDEKDCEALTNADDRRVCPEILVACTSPWTERKVNKATACNANFSYNGHTAAEWQQYVRDSNAWREQWCPAFFGGTLPMQDIHRATLAMFRNNPANFNDEGITCVCSDPKCDSFYYFYCKIHEVGTAASPHCAEAACTTNGFSCDGSTPTPGPTATPPPYGTPMDDPPLSTFVPTATPVPVGAVTTPVPTAVVVAVTPRPAVQTAAATPTGPGEATVGALIIASLATLLYVSYTHSASFRRREVKGLQDEHWPMDFRP